MPLCPDCRNDGILSPMLYTHDETVRKRGKDVVYCILVCIACGSSLRYLKNVKVAA